MHNTYEILCCMYIYKTFRRRPCDGSDIVVCCRCCLPPKPKKQYVMCYCGKNILARYSGYKKCSSIAIFVLLQISQHTYTPCACLLNILLFQYYYYQSSLLQFILPDMCTRAAIRPAERNIINAVDVRGRGWR